MNPPRCPDCDVALMGTYSHTLFCWRCGHEEMMPLRPSPSEGQRRLGVRL